MADDKNFTGEIRMIKYGIIPNLPSFQISVEQMVGGKENLVVTEIAKEQVADEMFEYHIICSKKNEKGVLGDSFIWKTYNKTPDEVQYFVPDTKHDYIRL